MNIGKDRVFLSKCQQQSLFTSNQAEDTRIELHCSESSKPFLVKAKDTNI